MPTPNSVHEHARESKRVLPANVIFSFGLTLRISLNVYHNSLTDRPIIFGAAERMSGSGSTSKKPLQVVEPEPVDERSPLLHRHSNGEACEEQDTEALEAQARQERREYDAGAVPVADELSTRKLVLTMGSLWLGTFFAALGMYIRIDEMRWYTVWEDCRLMMVHY